MVRIPTTNQQAAAVSRDEMAAALVDISEGRIPRDRVALQELHREMVNWPFLEEQGAPTFVRVCVWHTTRSVTHRAPSHAGTRPG